MSIICSFLPSCTFWVTSVLFSLPHDAHFLPLSAFVPLLGLAALGEFESSQKKNTNRVYSAQTLHRQYSVQISGEENVCFTSFDSPKRIPKVPF